MLKWTERPHLTTLTTDETVIKNNDFGALLGSLYLQNPDGEANVCPVHLSD